MEEWLLRHLSWGSLCRSIDSHFPTRSWPPLRKRLCAVRIWWRACLEFTCSTRIGGYFVSMYVKFLFFLKNFQGASRQHRYGPHMSAECLPGSVSISGREACRRMPSTFVTYLQGIFQRTHSFAAPETPEILLQSCQLQGQASIWLLFLRRPRLVPWDPCCHQHYHTQWYMSRSK